MSRLTRSQIAKASADAQVDFCLDKQPTYEVALARRIEAAATEPLLQRIAHLEATASANYGRGHADAHSMLSERIAGLERQLHEQAVSLEEARKDAERYRWLRSDDIEVPHGQREICVLLMRLPFREDQTDELLIESELDAAIDAAMQKGQS